MIIKMEKDYKISDLSAHLFWDVNRNNLSIEKSSHYIIERVASLGSLEDWLLIRKIYGEDKVKEVILNMRYLDEKSLYFYATIFNISLEKFKCYTLRKVKSIT